jgi:hypothetical protein
MRGDLAEDHKMGALPSRTRVAKRLWDGEYQARFNTHYHRIAKHLWGAGELLTATLTLTAALAGVPGTIADYFTATPALVTTLLSFLSALLLLFQFSQKHREHYYLYRRWMEMEVKWKEVSNAFEYNTASLTLVLDKIAEYEVEALRVESEQSKPSALLLRHSENKVRREAGIQPLLRQFPVLGKPFRWLADKILG